MVTGSIGNQRMIQDYPDYSIVEIDQNTEKSPGDLKRLAFTQTQVKDHQLMHGRIEEVQTTALLISAGILKKVLGNRRDLLLSKLRESHSIRVKTC